MKADPAPISAKPVKIQPKKGPPIQTVSEHGLGQINPKAPPVPATVEKATKQIAAALSASKANAMALAAQHTAAAPPPTAASPAAGPQAPVAGNDFASFLAQFYPQQAPPDTNALIEQYLAPLKRMYDEQYGQIQQQSQQQLGFDNSLAMQLGDYLKGLGGSDYTPTMAAALGLEAQRNDRYATSQAQSKLYDSIYGSSKSDIAKIISDANDAYNASQPSSADALSAYKIWNDSNPDSYANQRQAALDNAQLTHLQNQDSVSAANYNLNAQVKQQGLTLLKQKLGLAATKQYTDVQLKKQGLSLQQRKQVLAEQKAAVQQKQFVAKYNLSVTKFNQSRTDAATKRQQANAAMSGKLGFLADASGNPIPDALGKKRILPGFRVKNGQVVKAYKPSTSAAATTATDKVTWPNLSKTQVMHLRSGIANSFYGFKDKNGKQYDPLPYADAINHAVQSGYSRAGAVKMANRFYMPGQHGRPKRTGP